jgi:hypothetical protein
VAQIAARQVEQQAEHRPRALHPPAVMALLDRRPPAPAGQVAAVTTPPATRHASRKPTVAEALAADLAARRGETSASTPEQPPAEAAPAAATPTTGRGTRRGRDISPFVSVEDPDQLNRSFLEGYPAPRGSKDASGQPYDSAMSWVSGRLQKQCTLKEAEKVI